METIADLQEQIKALQKENACLSIRTTPSMLPIYKRIAQLCFIQSKRPLRNFEQEEMNESLKAYGIFDDKLLDLHSLSIVAYDAGDTEWQHEICRQIEKLEG